MEITNTQYNWIQLEEGEEIEMEVTGKNRTCNDKPFIFVQLYGDAWAFSTEKHEEIKLKAGQTFKINVIEDVFEKLEEDTGRFKVKYESTTKTGFVVVSLEKINTDSKVQHESWDVHDATKQVTLFGELQDENKQNIEQYVSKSDILHDLNLLKNLRERITYQSEIISTGINTIEHELTFKLGELTKEEEL